MNESVTIKVNIDIAEEIKHHYIEYLVNNSGEYINYQIKKGNLVITSYLSTNHEDKSKIVFNGPNALKEAKKWDNNAKINIKKENKSENWVCIENQIGSDEVGVGDFLLPMIVVASFVRKKDINMLKEFGVDDSKKLTDAKIREIGEELSKKVFVSRLTLSNEKYNEMYKKGENINSLKAKMHNRALLNMFKKFPDTKHIFVDQFVKESTYYSYLNDKSEIKLGNIVFKTKGESSYPSVALSSVIARYAFLLEKDALEAKYKMNFPLGASKNVDTFSKKFIKKYGIKEFNKICKMNFANYQRSLD